MLTYIDGSGNLVKTIPEKVYQGSNYANTIYLIGAYPQASVVQIAFKLPQTGHYTPPYLMLNATDIQTDIGVNAWSFDVPVAITEFSGKVELQVKVIGGSKTIYVKDEETGNYVSQTISQTIASARGTFEVERGTQVDVSEIEAPDVYAQIVQLISDIQGQINDNSLIGKGILPYDSAFEYPLNALTYYEGTFFKSKVAENQGNDLPDLTQNETENEYWEKWNLYDIVALFEAINSLQTGLDAKQNITDGDLQTANKHIVPAINEVNRIKQDKYDEELDTTSKYVVGAINELKTAIDEGTGGGYEPDGTTIQLNASEELEAIAIKDGTGTITPSDVRTNASDITAINNKIPTGASSSNKLATASDITSITELIPSGTSTSNKLANATDISNLQDEIQTQTAHFRGSWANWTAVPTSANDYPADSDGVKTPSKNDYIAIQDASDYSSSTVELGSLTGTWRFIYSGSWATNGKNGWLPAYQINETPLTTEQLNALNSGIDSTKVGQIATNTSNISSLSTNKADKSATVSTVAYDGTNKKITKTINGTTTDVVSTATLKSDMGLATVATSGAFSDLSGKPTSLSASQGGTDTSLVTTGEKYIWNNKQNALPTISTAGKLLKSTSTAGTVEWGDAPSSVTINTTSGSESISDGTNTLSFGANAFNSTTIPSTTDNVTQNSTSALTSGGAYTALGNKQDTLVSGTNIKTINNQSILGSGNISISGGGSGTPAIVYMGSSEPSSDNTGDWQMVILDHEPTTKYDGYVYVIIDEGV